jgi:hypothetical protein
LRFSNKVCEAKNYTYCDLCSKRRLF